MNKINTTLLPVSFDISAGEEKSDRIVKAPLAGKLYIKQILIIELFWSKK